MWMSSPACFWMAATTSGWQWPVEVTAMPAEKSRNSFPSTSSTTTPRPFLATMGYERVYDGEISRSSAARILFALGPGRAVLMFGPAMVLVVMLNLQILYVMGRARDAQDCKTANGLNEDGLASSRVAQQ